MIFIFYLIVYLSNILVNKKLRLENINLEKYNKIKSVSNVF